MKDGFFEENDIVRFWDGDKWRYVFVTNVGSDYIEGDYCEGDEFFGNDDNFPIDALEYVEPTYFSTEKLNKFLLCEISYDEMTNSLHPCELAKCDGEIYLEAEHMIALLKKFKSVDIETFRNQVIFPISYAFSESIKRFFWNDSDTAVEGYRNLYGERYFVWNIWDEFENEFWNYEYCEKDVDTSQLDFIDKWIEELEELIKERDIPVIERNYPDWVKRSYIENNQSDYQIETATADELALFVKFTEELCEKKDPDAMKIKAYACYGGNRAYECDWFTSRDLLLALMKTNPDRYYANTLGYIYYYGRCNEGKPEYSKAFKYFNIGAAGYIYESRYKLADMYLHGYYVTKDVETAKTILFELYDENLKYILKNKLDCKFADVALRIGNLYKDENPDLAYKFYLQADFAIRMRLKNHDWYGDNSVAAGVSKAIDEILPKTSYEKKCMMVNFTELDTIFAHTFKKHRQVEMKVKKLKDGYSLKFRIIPKGDDKYPLKFFLTLPEAHYCGLVDSITVKALAGTEIYIKGRKFTGDKVTVIFDEFERFGTLKLYGYDVASVYGDFKYKVKAPDKEKSYTFASVIFDANGYQYDYLCEIPDVKVGDKVIVNTARGEATVDVVKVFEKTSSETALPIDKYKHILRKV